MGKNDEREISDINTDGPELSCPYIDGVIRRYPETAATMEYIREINAQLRHDKDGYKEMYTEMKAEHHRVVRDRDARIAALESLIKAPTVITMNSEDERILAESAAIEMCKNQMKDIFHLQGEIVTLKENLHRSDFFKKELSDHNFDVKSRLAAAEKVIEEISKADCPKYMAHPQSVWWQIHVVDKAKEYLQKKKGTL